MLKINEAENVGRAKYVVSYYTGKTHADGSEFYDMRIFTNKRLKDKFVGGGSADCRQMKPVRKWKAGEPAPPGGFTIQSAHEIAFHESTREAGVRFSLRREKGRFVVSLRRQGWETLREELDTEVAARTCFERRVEAHYE